MEKVLITSEDTNKEVVNTLEFNGTLTHREML